MATVTMGSGRLYIDGQEVALIEDVRPDMVLVVDDRQLPDFGTFAAEFESKREFPAFNPYLELSETMTLRTNFRSRKNVRQQNGHIFARRSFNAFLERAAWLAGFTSPSRRTKRKLTARDKERIEAAAKEHHRKAGNRYYSALRSAANYHPHHYQAPELRRSLLETADGLKTRKAA